MSNEYLHLSCDTNKFWVATLTKRLDDSPNVTLRERVTNWQDSPMYEAGLAINTKLAMLDQVVARIDCQLQLLGEQVSDRQELERCLRRGTDTAYRIRNKDVFFKALVDIDSFLFESRSTYEIVGQFLREFFKQIFGRSLSEDELKTALTDSRIDTRWIDQLRDNRILFFHQTAPWIAVRVVSKEPLKFELIILKQNVRDFTNPDNHVDFERLRGIYKGFRSSMSEIHRWIEKQIEEFERAEPVTNSSSGMNVTQGETGRPSMVKKTPWYSMLLALSPKEEGGLCAFGVALSFGVLLVFRKDTPAIAIAGIAALLWVVISRLGAIVDQLRHLNGTIHAVIAAPGEDFISVADLKRLRRALGIERDE